MPRATRSLGPSEGAAWLCLHLTGASFGSGGWRLQLSSPAGRYAAIGNGGVNSRPPQHKKIIALSASRFLKP